MFWISEIKPKKCIAIVLMAPLVLTLGLATNVIAQTETGRPKITETSVDLGPTQPQKELTFTVHLKLHNEDAYDKAIEMLYTPGSPTYHQWMTKNERANYAPTSAEIVTVKKELESHGVSIVSVGADNSSIRARGTVTNIESAFQTQIHEFERDGQTFSSNITSARLTGDADTLVKSVSGLSNVKMRQYIQLQADPLTGKALSTVPVSKLSSNSLGQNFTNNCFGNSTIVLLTTLFIPLPVGQYHGNSYSPGNIPCGWTPAQIQTHYNLTDAYAHGIDGSGQTIVIVDAPADPSIQDDLVAFSNLAGLPPITSANFQIIYPDGVPTAAELQSSTNGDLEADLDTQWVHAIAPQAKIIVLITPTQDLSEFEYAVQYATENKLGNVISNSYGVPEKLWDPSTLSSFDQVLKTAAASGIAVNFASGDAGDQGTGSPNAGGASYPASSAYVTSVGGTSIGLPNNLGGTTEVGWGNDITYLSLGSTLLLNVPFQVGFLGGSGGGESTFITKPTWQAMLPGSGRQQPDISAFADPHTGALIVSKGAVTTAGGTSLATPVFSAIWALADQQAGKALGQAAPLIAGLPSTAITDIVPYNSPTNAAGTVVGFAGSTSYSATSLLTPLYTTTQFFSTLWDASGTGAGQYVDLSFGTDSSLTVAPGWDNVTGWGIPNGWAFITATATAK